MMTMGTMSVDGLVRSLLLVVICVGGCRSTKTLCHGTYRIWCTMQGDFLAFSSAWYGHNGQSTSCSLPDVSFRSCGLIYVLDKINYLCYGRAQCRLHVDDASFGYQCPSNRNFLQYKPLCVQAKLVKSACLARKYIVDDNKGYIESYGFPTFLKKECLVEFHVPSQRYLYLRFYYVSRWYIIHCGDTVYFTSKRDISVNGAVCHADDIAPHSMDILGPSVIFINFPEEPGDLTTFGFFIYFEVNNLAEVSGDTMTSSETEVESINSSVTDTSQTSMGVATTGIDPTMSMNEQKKKNALIGIVVLPGIIVITTLIVVVCIITKVRSKVKPTSPSAGISTHLASRRNVTENVYNATRTPHVMGPGQPSQESSEHDGVAQLEANSLDQITGLPSQEAPEQDGVAQPGANSLDQSDRFIHTAAENEQFAPVPAEHLQTLDPTDSHQDVPGPDTMCSAPVYYNTLPSRQNILTRDVDVSAGDDYDEEDNYDFESITDLASVIAKRRFPSRTGPPTGDATQPTETRIVENEIYTVV